MAENENFLNENAKPLDSVRYNMYVYLQSGSRVHSGPHPVMVSGLGISPGWQLQIAFPIELTVQVVPGPHGDGWQGFFGGLDNFQKICKILD